MKLARKVGSTSQILQVFIRDSSSTTGGGLTGLVFNSSSLTAYYHRDTDTTATAIVLITMTVGTFTSLGFKEIDSVNMPGWYQFCPPNAALASGAASVVFHLKGATNMAPLPIEVDLDAQADVTHWNGTAVTSPNTAGTPVVDVGRVNNVATTSVTTINANLGTTQPVNFTGTAGSALAKSDVVDIAGAAVSATTAQLGVNVVNIKGTASAGAAGYAGVDWSAVNAPTTTVALTGTTIATTQQVDVNTIKTQAITCAAGVTVLASVGTASTSTAQTGDSFARIGATGSGLTSLAPASTALSTAQWTNARATSLDNLDAAVSTRSTYAGADTSGTTTLLGRLTSTRAGLLDNLDAAVSTRLATSGYTAPLDAAGTRTAVGLATANLDTQLGAIAGYIDTEVAAIKAKTDQMVFTVAGKVDATATIGGNVTVGGYASGQDPATLVLDATASGHNTAGTIGNKINSAASAGDPWSTAEPGSYAAGTYGYLVSHALAAPGTTRTVTQDYLGTDRLTVEDPPGNPVLGAVVTAYLATLYEDTGGATTPVASTTTDASGHWSLTIAPAEYTLTFVYAGRTTRSTFVVT